MKLTEEQVAELLVKNLAKTLTPEEEALLAEWIAASPANGQQFEALSHLPSLKTKLQDFKALDETAGDFMLPVRRILPVHYLRRWAAAAAILLLAATGGYFLLLRHATSTFPNVAGQFKNDVAPGGNKAVLTLANGQQVILDSAHNGQIASQGNSKVVKVNNGLLAYHLQTAHNQQQITIQYNTLVTPRGGQYRIVLPDGSKVWLNAASSIRYPTVFTGKERVVEVTGETYFEVAHNDRMPFKVKVNHAMIEDIGTHFDINAYPDEAALKTTLLEGSVKVDDLALQPGEQACISPQGQITVIKNVDVEEVVAWKNGDFRFNSADIQTIMRQVARWYDVEIAYRGQVHQTFSGGISRDVNVSQLLHILELTKAVGFDIEGKKIIVQPVKSK